MRICLAVVGVFAVGCSGGTHTSPANPTSPPASSTITLTGTVMATNGGQALAGAAIDVAGQHVLADASGAYRVEVPPGRVTLTISGAGLVPHVLPIDPSASPTLALEAIAQSGGFDQTYYRQLVRNTLDAPMTMAPLRRWTVNPSFYMKMTDEAGVMMDAKTLDNTEQVIRAFVPQWTSGRFAVAAFERGTMARSLTAGWINVNWSNASRAVPSGGFYCGDSDVARNPGTINFYYKANQNTTRTCRCAGQSEIGSRVVSHELGHAMGFWHAGKANDVMFPGTGAYCDATLSARELYHAAIAYRRPTGNVDPDTDP